MRRTFRGLSLSVLGAVSMLPLAAQQVDLIRELKHGVSPPLRTMALETGAVSAPIVRARPRSPIMDATPIQQEDGAVQALAGPSVGATPGLNILGLGNGFVGPQGAFTVQYAPPDTNASVGATQVAEVVNVSYAVFDKSTGSPTLGPISIASLWNGFDTDCSGSTNLSDPVVLYDKQAGRWVVEAITVSSPFKYCFAVSQTSDATGAYNLYSFQETVGLPDYAKIGVWPDAYYISSRMFQNGATYLGPRACAVDRNQMLAGQAATMQCFQVSSTAIDGMLPSDLDGATPPPAGAPNTFVIQGANGANKLILFRFHVDWANPANSRFRGVAALAVAAYTQAASQKAVPQSGTRQKLDALGNFLMHRAAYRNFPAAVPPYESLVVNHSVNVSSGSTATIGVRWYEVRNVTAGAPAIFQQGTFSPDTTYRWMGSIAMDKVGNIAVGYSASSSAIHPAIRYTGRVPTDPLGTMQAEATIFSGNGAQMRPLNRWGDYSSMSVDPTDDCTMWYAQEYIPSNGTFNWATRLFSFKFPTCQ